MTPQDFQPLIDLFTSTHASYAAGGMLVALSTALYGLVKIVRTNGVQNLLGRISTKLQWANWPVWGRMVFVFSLSAAGSALGAIASGTAVVAALPAAVVAGLVAMGVDGAVSASVKPANPT